MSLFGTAGIRGPVASVVGPELAVSVGRAAGTAASEAGEAEFIIGRDGRLSGSTLQRAMVAGLQTTGVDVRLAGRVPTPALAFASRGRHGVMLTASHNPPADNGIKLFRDGVEYGRMEEAEVERRVRGEPDEAPWNEWTEPRRESVLDGYRTSVVEYAERYGEPLDDLPIVVDCGNGMAGLVTPQVLRSLGAEVVALSANIDGTFPARRSKPTSKSLSDLRSFVADGDWVLGFGADGDADRLVLVDADGEVVHEDTVLAILAEAFVSDSEVEDPVVVTTPNASARVDDRVKAAGGEIERVALGYVHEGVASVRETGRTVVFAGEPWKHIHPALGGWIDGVASAAVLARLVSEAGGLDPLREPVTERPYRKVSIDCPDEDKAAVMAQLESALPERFPQAAVTRDHGLRLDRPDGSWVLVRPSGTEPYVRVYAEAEDVDALVEQVLDVVEMAVDTAA